MKDVLEASPVTLVFDHYGNAKEELGVAQPGFSDLVNLVRSGKAYVKISVTAGPRENYGYFTPLAQMLIDANADASCGAPTSHTCAARKKMMPPSACAQA